MKKYIKLYSQLKDLILKGELKSGEKIPSVRKCASLYNVSITTVQNAYFDLCADGYIIAHQKSGYYVSDISNNINKTECEEHERKIHYDLRGGKADEECFDLILWQRYIKSALRQTERLLSYSQPEGEYDLRQAIAQYIREKRNVVTSADRIVIGAGVQPLLHILCSLLSKDSTVSFPDKSFVQGIGIFHDYGFDVHTRDKDADIIYVSPSHMTRWGDVMPISRRLELVKYSLNNNSLVIEDDYENEFLYNTKPAPSLYALGKSNIIYISSFSAMLLPGIRISFMVLTDDLKRNFDMQKYRFAQTASKTEQIALCNYIRDGHINSQTRKISRLYTAKVKRFADILRAKMPDAKISIGENMLQIKFECFFNKNTDIFEKHGIAVYVESYENNRLRLIISPSGIPANNLENAAIALKNAIL